MPCFPGCHSDINFAHLIVASACTARHSPMAAQHDADPPPSLPFASLLHGNSFASLLQIGCEDVLFVAMGRLHRRYRRWSLHIPAVLDAGLWHGARLLTGVV